MSSAEHDAARLRRPQGRFGALADHAPLLLGQSRVDVERGGKTPITADLLNDRVVPFFDAHDVKLLRFLSLHSGTPWERVAIILQETF
jgi:hypothetical protein